jgi:hypothetical protein
MENYDTGTSVFFCLFGGSIVSVAVNGTSCVEARVFRGTAHSQLELTIGFPSHWILYTFYRVTWPLVRRDDPVPRVSHVSPPMRRLCLKWKWSVCRAKNQN